MQSVFAAVRLVCWYLKVSTSRAPASFPCGNPPDVAASAVWRPNGPNESAAQSSIACDDVVTGLPVESYTHDLAPGRGYSGPYFLSNSFTRLPTRVGAKFVYRDAIVRTGELGGVVNSRTMASRPTVFLWPTPGGLLVATM